MTKRTKVGGLFTALLTPFDSKGRVDLEALARLVRFQAHAGADGLYVCGTTGLGPLLSLPERKSIAETVSNELSGTLPMVVQVGCADTASAVDLAAHAEGLGAEAVASLTPYYYKPGDAAVRKHFEAIASAVKSPLFAYNIPQFTGNNLAAETVASMAGQGTIVGIKDSSRDVLHLLEVLDSVPESFVVMNGTEEYGLFSLMMGGDGLVSGGANAAPELMKALVSLHAKGDYRAAVSAQETVLRFRACVKASPIPAYYEILRSRGVDCGKPRQPFLALGKQEARGVQKALEVAGISLGPTNG